MYRILTGLCCAVWCAVIAVEAFGLNKRQEMALDSFEMASCFNDEFTDDVTAQIRLYGTGPALTSEEEIRKANGDFLAEVKYLKEKAPNIDLVLFPVDRRMGKDYMKGAKQFIEQIKTTIFVPMHFSEDYEGGNALLSFAENAGCRFISITHRGESFEITK